MEQISVCIKQKEHVNGAIWEMIEKAFKKTFNQARRIGKVRYYFTDETRYRISKENGFPYSKGEFLNTEYSIRKTISGDRIEIILNWDGIMCAAFWDFKRAYPKEYEEMVDEDKLIIFFPEDFREIYRIGKCLEFMTN